MQRLPLELSELDMIQNPAIGAFAIWRFSAAYQMRDARRPTLALAFLVLPLVLHEDTRNLISSTRLESGLAVFIAKLGEHRENLLAVHKRAFQLRPLTMESVAVALGTELLSLDYERATILASMDGTETIPRLPERIKWLEPCSKKLGYWFAGLNDEHVARSLRVDF